jgi:hypothetical protein
MALISPKSDPIAYKKALAEAIEWKEGEGSQESWPTIGTIFRIDGDAIRMAFKRKQNRTRNALGSFNSHGGNNKILSVSQEDAILSYCFNQWEQGLGATKRMVFQAITFLKTHESPPKEGPSWRWFAIWLHKVPTLHTIKTKPIAYERVESHTEESIKEWFEGLRETQEKYGIRKAKRVLNMDESGARLACPRSEEVIVPINCKELYTISPENRQSLTIIETVYADGREPLPPFIICPGKQIMDNWIHDQLQGEESITTSPTGYTNNDVIMEYLEHLIEFSGAGPCKEWRMLLCDGHITHLYPEFVIKAAENHIVVHTFPSHLTHCLQPLDVGIFRPWKHYQNQAIQEAIRAYDREYSITHFFRDLSKIRKNTMKKYTIKSAFRESGMWPVSLKAGLKKIRQYSKKKTSQQDDDNDKPTLPPITPNTYFECGAAIQEWIERGPPEEYSSPSKERFTKSLSATKSHLAKADLVSHEHYNLQTKLYEESKRKTTSRRSIHKGGRVKVNLMREKKRKRDDFENSEAIRKARKRITAYENKAKKELTARGVVARKEEKARKAAVAELAARGEIIPFHLAIPIREPDKNPTQEEREALIAHPSLQQALNELLKDQDDISSDPILAEDRLEIRLEYIEEPDPLEDIDAESDSTDTVDLEGLDEDSSDAESFVSNDSITRNADFIPLWD